MLTLYFNIILNNIFCTLRVCACVCVSLLFRPVPTLPSLSPRRLYTLGCSFVPPFVFGVALELRCHFCAVFSGCCRSLYYLSIYFAYCILYPVFFILFVFYPSFVAQVLEYSGENCFLVLSISVARQLHFILYVGVRGDCRDCDFLGYPWDNY